MIGTNPIPLWLAGQKYYVFEISGTNYELSMKILLIIDLTRISLVEELI